MPTWRGPCEPWRVRRQSVLAELSGSERHRSSEEIRDWIVAELARALKIDPRSVDVAAPLYSLGADSLAAITLTGSLAEWLQKDIPATLMWDHESIDAIAFALGDPRAVAPPAGVIHLQPRGRLTPLFCFPGALGHSVTFAPLATHLGPDQPCYGLTVPGLDGEHAPLESIEQIATVMLGKIRLLQPNGPYQFAGYSLGGLLGFEVAQQLRRQGETVAVLALYDTFTPQGYVERPRWQRLAVHAYILLTQAGRLEYVQQKLQRRRELRDARRSVGRTHTTVAEAREKLILQMEQTNIRAALKYRPQPYDGPLLLFRATERGSEALFFRVEARTNGWGALAGERVRIIDIPGSHQSILRPENGAQAAELLRPHLAQSGPASERSPRARKVQHI